MSGNNIAAGLPNRGKTRYGLTGVIPSTFLGDSILEEGVKREFLDLPAAGAGGATQPRTSGSTVCLWVRNASGVTLNAGDVVKWKALFRKKRVDVKNDVADGPVAGVVDDKLSAAGVRNGDCFWLMVSGPAYVNKPTGGGTAQAEGALIVADAAGRGVVAGVPGSATEAQDQATNHLGRVRVASIDGDAQTLVDLDIES